MVLGFIDAKGCSKWRLTNAPCSILLNHREDNT